MLAECHGGGVGPLPAPCSSYHPCSLIFRPSFSVNPIPVGLLLAWIVFLQAALPPAPSLTLLCLAVSALGSPQLPAVTGQGEGEPRLSGKSIP